MASPEAPCWFARPDVLERTIASTLLVLPADGPGMKLNGPAASIFDRTRRGASAAAITTEVAAEFAVEPAAVEALVVETLEALEAAGVVDRR